MPDARTTAAIAVPVSRAIRRATLTTLALAALLGATLTSFDAARLSASPSEAVPPSTAAVHVVR